MSFFRPILLIATKDIRLLLRDPPGWFFTLVFPVLFGLGFGALIATVLQGPQQDSITVAVLDQDNSPAAATLIQRFDQREPIRVVAHTPAHDDPAQEDPAENDTNTETPARVLHQHHAAALLTIPPGFESRLNAIPLADRPELVLATDPSAPAEAMIVQAELTAVATALAAEALQQSLDLPATLTAEPPVNIRATPIPISADPTTPDSAYQLTFAQGAVWGIVGCVTGFGLSLVGERTSGTFARLAIAPIRKRQILLAKALSCFLCCLAVLAILHAAFWPMGVRPGPIALSLVVYLSIAFGFSGLMMCLAAIARTDGGAEGMVRAVLLTMALAGGGGVPKMFFTGPLEWIPRMSPFGWAIEAIDAVIWRQQTLEAIAIPCLLLITMGSLGLLIASRSLTAWKNA